MKVEIIKGSYNNGIETLGKGKTLDLDDKEAKSLIALGVARKIGDTKQKTEEEEVLAREGLEKKALELKIGAPEEIKALSDKDLTDKIKKAEGKK